MKRTICFFRYFGLLIITLSIFIIPGCNIDIFNYLPGFEIDTLYAINSHYNYEIGDTIQLCCEATHPDNDSLTYTWSSNSGTIIPNGKYAKFVFSEYAVIEISCRVVDEHNKWIEDVITLDKSDKILVRGVLKANHSYPDTLLCNVPFIIQYRPEPYIYYTDELETSSDGTFSFTWTKPLVNLELVIDGYYVNLPDEGSYRKNILIEDFKKIDENNYELVIILDIPSTCNYYNYFPFSVGNKWIYKSVFGAPDDYMSHHMDGIETWEITEINETQDTLILDIDYQGMKYSLRQMSDTATPDDDTTNKEIINIHAQYKLFTYGNFMRYLSTESKIGLNSNLVPIGENIFKYGLPFKFETIEDTTEFQIPFYGWFYGYHTVAYGIGLTNFYSNTNNFYYEGEYFSLNLLSFDLDE